MIKQLKQKNIWQLAVILTLSSIFLATALAVLNPSLTNAYVEQKNYSNVTTANKSSTLFANLDTDKKEIDSDMDCKNAQNLNDDCGIVKLIIDFTNILSAVFGIVVVIVIIIAGIQYSASAGDPQAAAAAKKRITNAILAIVMYGAMYGFLQWIVLGGIF